MRQRWGKLIVFLVILFCFSFTANAEDTYKEQYDASGAADLYDKLSDEAKEYFSSLDGDLSDYDWAQSVNPQSILERIFDLIKTGYKKPLSAVAAGAAVMLIAAAVKSLSTEGQDADKTSSLVCVLGLSGITVIPVCSLISTVGSALKGCSTFMLSFVPVYTGILTVSGRTSSAVSGGLLITAAETVSMFVSFVVVPMISATLALGVSSSVSTLTSGGEAAVTLKKITVWCLSTVSAVFTGVLSMQTIVGGVADNMKMRTAKMFTSSVVPVVGPALSESLSTVAACFTMLRSSVGIFGVLALCVMMLPVLIEILIWRGSIMLLSLLSSFLGLSAEATVIKAVDSALSLMAATMLIISLLFIVALTVTIIVGGAA